MLLAVASGPLLTGCQPTRSDAKDHSPGPVLFANEAEGRGIRYRWPDQPRPLTILTGIGRGCAFLDYDNDGWQDILLAAAPHPRLFRNRGNGTFLDVTADSGLDRLNGDWRGCAVADVDGDGARDLFLLGYRCLRLLRNGPDHRWQDITAAAGLSPTNRGHWGTSAGFMDFGEGRSELVLLNYVTFGPHDEQFCEFRPGLRSACPPGIYPAESAEMWANDGAGHFHDVSRSAGLATTHGKGLALAFADCNEDGQVDLYIGNDGRAADLLLKERGVLRFRSAGAASGATLRASGSEPLSAMSADWADYDRDGHLDLAVSDYADAPDSIFHNQGGGLFQHMEDTLGITGPTFKAVGFGGKWLDFDNDGWPDLAFANGHVIDGIERLDPMKHLRDPIMLFHNQLGRQFRDLVPRLGGELGRPILGRGLATGDFDNDGRVDLLAVDYEGAPLLLHNTSSTAGHWITLDLRAKGADRLAYGARITARAGSQVWVGQVSPASSYLSSSDPRVHFGLGPVTELDSIAVEWPTGRNEEFRHQAVDRIVHLREGDGSPTAPQRRSGAP